MSESNRRLGKLHNQLLALALIVLPLLVFSRAISGDFLNWDDWKYVQGNPDLRPENWRTLLTYWYQPHIRLFIPLTFTAYAALEWTGIFLTGAVQPWIFHAGNLLLHVASGWVLWKLLTRILADSKWAATGAALFLLHPAQTEAVCWIGNLNTLLSGFLAIVTLYFYVRSLDPPHPNPHSHPHRHRFYFMAACITAALALLSKPSACGLPIMAWALHRIIDPKDSKRAGSRFAILCAIELPLIWIAHRLQADLGTTGFNHANDMVPWPHRLLVAVDSIGFYATKVLAPVGLAFDYGRTPDKVAAGLPAVVGSLTLISTAALLLVKPLRNASRAFAGGAVFLAALLPVLGFVPFDFQFYSTVADRYLYLAMVGPSLLAASLLQRIVLRSPPRQSVALVTACAVLLIFASLSFIQAGVWTSDFALFEHALSINPKSVAANQTLGFLAAQAADQNADDPNTQNALRTAAFEYDRRALSQRPDNPRVQYNLANLLLKTGRPDQSLANYAAAAGRTEDEAGLQDNWGVACLQLHRFDEGLGHFQRALDANPNSADAFANAGIAYLRLGQPDLARQQFRRALELDPRQPQAASALGQLSSGGR